MAELSRDLRVNLGKVFLLGYLDYSAGTPVEDDDEIPSALGLSLVQMAEQCIAKAEPILADLFRENPQLTYDTVYAGSVSVCLTRFQILTVTKPQLLQPAHIHRQ